MTCDACHGRGVLDGVDAAYGSTSTCDECEGSGRASPKARNRAKARARWQGLVANGLCGQCAQPRGASRSAVRCAACHADHVEAMRLKRSAQRATPEAA